jgi:hypothetical protein
MSSRLCSHIAPRRCASGTAAVLGALSLTLYSQCAAMPFSATACIGSVRIWNSTAVPSGLTSVVCRLW